MRQTHHPINHIHTMDRQWANVFALYATSALIIVALGPYAYSFRGQEAEVLDNPLRDLTGNGHDLSIGEGNPELIQSQDPAFGNGYNLQGIDDLVTPASPFNFTGDMAILMRIDPQSFNFAYIQESDNGPGAWTVGTTFQDWKYQHAASGGGTYEQLNGTPTIGPHTIVLNRNFTQGLGGDVQLEVDSTKVIDATIPSSQEPFPQGNSMRIQVSIYDLIILNRTVTANEIDEYNNGNIRAETFQESSLSDAVAYYSFGDSTAPAGENDALIDFIPWVFTLLAVTPAILATYNTIILLRR